MRCAGCVTHTAEKRNACRVVVKKPVRKDTTRKVMLKQISKKEDGRAWAGLIWLRMGDRWWAFVKR
jgi:hypothetical protein